MENRSRKNVLSPVRPPLMINNNDNERIGLNANSPNVINKCSIRTATSSPLRADLLSMEDAENVNPNLLPRQNLFPQQQQQQQQQQENKPTKRVLGPSFVRSWNKSSNNTANTSHSNSSMRPDLSSSALSPIPKRQRCESPSKGELKEIGSTSAVESSDTTIATATATTTTTTTTTTMMPMSKTQMMIIPSTTTNTTQPPMEDDSQQDQVMASTRIVQDDNIKHQQDLSLQYPTQIAVPNKKHIASWYNQAVAIKTSNQANLAPLGLLSLEDVLIPAVAQQEEAALKLYEAKIKRDQPHLVPVVQQCRRAVKQAMGAAIVAARQARLQREQQQRMRQIEHVKWLKQQRLLKIKQKEQKRKLKEQQKAIQKEQRRQQRLQELRRNYPKNQQLWRELVLLMTEKTQLEKEERLWKEAQIKILEQQQKKEATQQDQESSQSTNMGDNKTNEITADQQIDSDQNALIVKVEETMKETIQSSNRIQQGLDVVLTTLAKSTEQRKELSRMYRKYHQFHGYQNVNNPKMLVRFLSQSQDENDCDGNQNSDA